MLRNCGDLITDLDSMTQFLGPIANEFGSMEKRGF
jgi:hypothetical protein